MILVAPWLLLAWQIQLPMIDHGALDRVLQRHVQGQLVDYQTLAEESDSLDRYLHQLARVAADSIDAMARDERLALWINAYNACTLKLVVDHYPIERAGFPASLVRMLRGIPDKSIRQIPDTWSRRFCEVGGSARSLDEIEHEIIRPMGDPRIHFAVNCAARSCPVLAPSAYRPQHLDAQLDAAVRRFVADERHYELERGDPPVIHLNRVLDWYRDDFGGVEGVVAFLLPYLSREDSEYILNHGPPRIAFRDYDWTLNDTAIFGRSP